MTTQAEVLPARMGGAMVWSLMRRGLNEILRVPGAAVPGMLGAAFGALAVRQLVRFGR